jgi:hypothetical protein
MAIRAGRVFIEMRGLVTGATVAGFHQITSAFFSGDTVGRAVAGLAILDLTVHSGQRTADLLMVKIILIPVDQNRIHSLVFRVTGFTAFILIPVITFFSVNPFLQFQVALQAFFREYFVIRIVTFEAMLFTLQFGMETAQLAR